MEKNYRDMIEKGVSRVAVAQIMLQDGHSVRDTLVVTELHYSRVASLQPRISPEIEQLYWKTKREQDARKAATNRRKVSVTMNISEAYKYLQTKMSNRDAIKQLCDQGADRQEVAWASGRTLCNVQIIAANNDFPRT